MPIVDDVTDQIAMLAKVRAGNEELLRLTEFYDRMKSLGLVRKREYDLPLIDTIGRSLYHRASGTGSAR